MNTASIFLLMCAAFTAHQLVFFDWWVARKVDLLRARYGESTTHEQRARTEERRWLLAWSVISAFNAILVLLAPAEALL